MLIFIEMSSTACLVEISAIFKRCVFDFYIELVGKYSTVDYIQGNGAAKYKEV